MKAINFEVQNNHHDTEMKNLDSEKIFGFKSNFSISKFANSSSLVPAIEENYFFDMQTTQAILAGFTYNKKTIVTGLHGSGKSTHIEQIAARLNWPCIRINLDGQISRYDLLGRDVIKTENNQQVTVFEEGLLVKAVRNPIALILDEYDAAKPDVMFVLQRLLEQEGKLTLLEKNEVITPHPYFRVFATCNTLGNGDEYGIYHGTSFINQGQIDRWNQIIKLDYLAENFEIELLCKKFAGNKKINKKLIKNIVSLANFIRDAFKQEELSYVMSVRTIINFIENYIIYDSLNYAFKVSFYNRCNIEEQKIIAELFQKIFAIELN